MSGSSSPEETLGSSRSRQLMALSLSAEARYRIILLEDGAFAVEVSIPDSHPTRVSMFKTEADAEAWIAEHQRRVQLQIQSRRGFRPRGWN